MLDSIINSIPTIITVILGLGGVLLIVKKYTAPLKEVAELILTAHAAISDGIVTREEVSKIIKEAKNITEAINNLKGK